MIDGIDQINKKLMEFGIGMTEAMTGFKEATERAWDVLEGYGVTVEKLEKVAFDIDAGKITRREGWEQLGLPDADYPGGIEC